MNKDLQSVLKVKPCPSLSESARTGNNNAPSKGILNDDNADISNALQIANEIIETASLNLSRTVKDLVDCKETRAIKNVNIPFDKTIYRDLVELSILDEDLKNVKTVTIPRKHMPVKTRDTIPSLGDYRESSYHAPFVYAAKSEPPAKQMIRNYTGKEIYELFFKFRSSNL